MPISELVYDGVPPSVNAGGLGSRQHWAAGAKEKKKWDGIFTFLLLEAKVPRPLSYVAANVELQFIDPGRRRDEENYRPAISKSLADALVIGGWLTDDTREQFTLESLTISKDKLVPEHKGQRIKSRMTIQLHY